MRWWLLVACVGCRFTPGVFTGDAGSDDAAEDAQLDSDVDAAPVTCNARWQDGSIRFNTPVALTSLNSTQFDRDPFVAPDDKTIWLSSGRTGGMGDAVWVATRTSTTVDFDAPAVATAFDGAQAETKLSMTTDGLYAVVGSNRTGSQNIDVWETSRPTKSDPWAAMTTTHMTLVNTAGSDHDPTISADGLHLYLAPDTPSPQRLVVASRINRSANFTAPVAIAELFSNTGDADPSPTPDERILLFASNRAPPSSTPAAPNIWYATRATATGTFATPLLVPDINTDSAEGDPHLSADGCRIYFARDIGSYNYDIFVATAQSP